MPGLRARRPPPRLRRTPRLGFLPAHSVLFALLGLALLPSRPVTGAPSGPEASTSSAPAAFGIVAVDSVRKEWGVATVSRWIAVGARSIGLTHALGGCIMGGTAAEGVVDELGRVFDTQASSGLYDGLYVTDGSAVPTALGVNPSLTISAVSERAAEALVLRAKDLGLPAPPAGYKPGMTPPVHVGERVIPKLPHAKRRRHRRRKARA